MAGGHQAGGPKVLSLVPSACWELLLLEITVLNQSLFG